MLCESYNCKDSLKPTANNLEDRTYKVVPQNTDFEQPAIEQISVHNVVYDETQDHSDDTLELISYYLTNTDNEHCPINTCELMENCDSTSTPKTSDSTNIWAPTNQEIIDMAAASNANWATIAGTTHIYHVNTDPTSLFSYPNLCI